MANNTLQITDKTAFVFGMNWSVLDALDSRNEKIAEYRSRGGAYKASYKYNGEENIGWVKDVGQIDKGVKLLSGAGQVAVHPNFHGQTVLVLIEDDGEEGTQGTVAAVGLIKGNVIVDELVPASEVAKLREDFDDRCSKLSQTYKTVGHALTIDELDEFLDWADLEPQKIGKFKSSPAVEVVALRGSVPVPGMSVWLAIGVVAVAGYMAYDWYDGHQKAKRLSLVKTEASPEELYAASAATYLATPQVLAKDALPAIRSYVADLPVTFAGWNLKDVACGLSSCVLNWTRDFGTFAEFKALAPAEWTGTVYGESGETISTQFIIELKKTLLPDRSTWPTREEFKLTEISKWQVYKDIGITTTISPVVLLAVPPSVPAPSVEHSLNAIKAAPWSTGSESPWYTSETLDAAPLNMTYESVTVTVKPTDTTFEAKGKVYVKN